MSRIPRKKKKKLELITFDLDIMELYRVKKLAKAAGMRPSEYVRFAITTYLEVLKNDESK